MVVTGDTEGKVKFFDSELKMVNWYEDTMKFGPLCSISFSYSPSISMLNAKQAAGRRSAVCVCVYVTFVFSCPWNTFVLLLLLLVFLGTFFFVRFSFFSCCAC